MFTFSDMRALLATRPFVPFRLHLSDGGSVEVRTPEVVLAGKRFALIGILDPSSSDTAFDRYMTVWYLHVARHEMLTPGVAPFMQSGGPSATPAPA